MAPRWSPAATGHANAGRVVAPPRPDPPVPGARRGLTRDAQRLYFAGARRGAKNGGGAPPPPGPPPSTRGSSWVAARSTAPTARAVLARTPAPPHAPASVP